MTSTWTRGGHVRDRIGPLDTPSLTKRYGRGESAGTERSGDDVFCGDPGTPGYSACAAQTQLFALASAIPALLGMALLVAAFAAPSVRGDRVLRMRTLTYSLVAWGIAAGTYVMGGLPSV